MQDLRKILPVIHKKNSVKYCKIKRYSSRYGYEMRHAAFQMLSSVENFDLVQKDKNGDF